MKPLPYTYTPVSLHAVPFVWNPSAGAFVAKRLRFLGIAYYPAESQSWLSARVQLVRLAIRHFFTMPPTGCGPDKEST